MLFVEYFCMFVCYFVLELLEHVHMLVEFSTENKPVVMQVSEGCEMLK